MRSMRSRAKYHFIKKATVLENMGSTRIHIIDSPKNLRHQAFYKFVSLNSLHVLACFVVLPENIL